MLRLSINIMIFVCLFINCAVITACGFIDLRQIHFSVEPDNFDAILENRKSPVIIRFDTEMIKKDAEGIVQVSSDLGSVSGDFNWNGNDLYFVPVSGWTAGIRYTLSLNGTVRSADGRELRIQRFTSFYAITKNPPPLLVNYFPANGEAIGTNNFELVLHFSNSMDRITVESAVSIDGIGNKIFEWQDDDKILKITADKQLSAWTSYNWSLKETAKSSEGIPLPKQYSGSFNTNLDQVLPEVIRVFPVTFSSTETYGNWSATGAGIETGLSLGEGIAIEFNKPMGESVLRSVRFEPSLTGRAEMLAENTIVYVFTRNPEPETTYTMIISADARDAEGLKIGSEYRVSFMPDIPYLNVLSFSSNNDSLIENFHSGIVLPVHVNEGTGEVLFSIRFSLPFNNEEKMVITQKINLAPFFPRSLPPAALQYVSWVSDDCIIMRWEGLKASSEAANHYYLLTIPGGRGGISSGGLYMKENINIYLEAINEN